MSPTVGIVYHVHGTQVSSGGAANQRMHETVALRFADRAWWRPMKLERWRGKAEWNNLRAAARRRNPLTVLRCAARLLVSPQAAYGALSAAALRARLRRRCAVLARHA